jgi:hypothetical protein
MLRPIMKPNRSIPQAAVIPVLIYPDVREAVAWLSAAFGFEERVKIGENHRSQLKIGDGAVILGDVRNDRRPPRDGEVTRPLRASPGTWRQGHRRVEGFRVRREAILR